MADQEAALPSPGAVERPDGTDNDQQDGRPP